MIALTTSSNDSSFPTDVLQSSLPVLVDFWGEWCGPCKAMVPALEQVAADYAGRAKVVKVEMDKNPKTATAFRVCVRRRRCSCSRTAPCRRRTWAWRRRRSWRG